MGQWKRIIEEDRHDALVAALAPRKSKPRKGRTYPLVGFLVCGKCGGPLRSEHRDEARLDRARSRSPGEYDDGGAGVSQQHRAGNQADA